MVGQVPRGTVIRVTRIEDEVLNSILIEEHHLLAIGQIIDGPLSDKEIVLGWSPPDTQMHWPPCLARVE
jgi:hypothetical protein